MRSQVPRATIGVSVSHGVSKSLLLEAIRFNALIMHLELGARISHRHDDTTHFRRCRRPTETEIMASQPNNYEL